MIIYLIRHGKTYGNTLSRYIGITDEELCEEGIQELKSIAKSVSYENASVIYTSDLKRTIQTAEILFPDKKPIQVSGLRECDFGEFENQNYKELDGNPNYQAWIDSNGTLPFPGGESKEECAARQVDAFQKCIRNLQEISCECAAFVVHGGTIMNVMETFAEEKKAFYEWHVKNGNGYLLQLINTSDHRFGFALKIRKALK